MEQSSSKESLIAQLLDMGFTKELSEEAYNKSETKTLEEIILILDSIQNGSSNTNPSQQQQPSQQGESNPDKSNEESKENKVFEESQSITSMINQQFSMELQSMGYSKNVSEKALFLTQNLSIEKALDWINENNKSPDFEEELRIVGRAEEGPKMSKEEAAQKAKELQQKLREKRMLREKEEELERERNRIKGGKALTEARRELEEMQKKRDMEAKLRQKREDELARQKVLMDLQRDREERFGKKAGGVATSNQNPASKPLTPFDKIESCIKQLNIAYPNNLFPGAAKTCLKTILIYLENINKNPQEEKFRKINLANENFQKKIGNFIGGIGILTECGFAEENNFLLMKNPDCELITKAIQLISKFAN